MSILTIAQAEVVDGSLPGKSTTPAALSASDVLGIAFLAVFVFAADFATISFTAQTGRVAAIWISNAVIVAVLLRSPTRRWLPTLAAAFLANIAADMAATDTLPGATLLSLCNILEIAILAAPLRRWGLDADISRFRSLAAFYLLALGPAVIVAGLAGATVLYFDRGAPFWNSFGVWYASDGLALATISPIALTVRARDFLVASERTKLPATLALLGLLAATFFAMSRFQNLPLGFLLFPVLILFTLVRGFAGAAVCLAVTAVFMTMNIFDNTGYVSQIPNVLRERLILVQLFFAVSCATAMMVEAILAERRALVLELEGATRDAVAARDTAERASRTKSMFLANMSHELRTPLNAILGYAEIMRDGVLGPCNGKCQGHSARIHEAGSLLLDLINDVLDMAKIEADKLQLAFEDIDVCAIATQCLEFVETRAVQAGVTLESDIACSPFVIRADARAVKQIMLNLLSNAVKFTPAGGTVCLRVKRDGDVAIIRIEDSGVGIAASELPRLGIPFEQVRSSASVSHPGTGLGLALVRALSLKHGGDMTIESVEAEGTNVTIRLPVAGPAAADASQTCAIAA